MTATHTLEQSQTTTTFRPVRFTDVVTSEWIKLFGLRVNRLLLGGTVLGGLGAALAFAVTAESAGLPGSPSTRFVADNLTMGISLLGQILMGAMGALAMGGEYASGSIQSSLLAVPRRFQMYGAKTLVCFLAATGAGLITLLAAWATTYGIYAQHDLGFAIWASGLPLALVGASVQLGLCAVLGVGLGALLRSSTAAAVMVLVLLFALPVGVGLLPSSEPFLTTRLLMLQNAGEWIRQVPDPEQGLVDREIGYLHPGLAWLVSLGWATVAFVLGAVQLRKSDA